MNKGHVQATGETTWATRQQGQTVSNKKKETHTPPIRASQLNIRIRRALWTFAQANEQVRSVYYIGGELIGEDRYTMRLVKDNELEGMPIFHRFSRRCMLTGGIQRPRSYSKPLLECMYTAYYRMNPR